MAELSVRDPARTPRARIRCPGEGAASEQTIMVDPARTRDNGIPAKEWAITDDVLNASDSASVSIANNDGEHTGKFQCGQRVEIDESDPSVASGQWSRIFTGRITAIDESGDIGGGENILLSMMDLGWHLTMSHGKPLVNLQHVTFENLVKVGGILIDPTWGFAPTEFSNTRNRYLLQGRIGITRTLHIDPTAVLPYIQIEPGQTPYDILRTYCTRQGFLVNVGRDGQLILFQPDFIQQPSYNVEYHSSKSPLNNLNNIIGRARRYQQIDGLYSEVQCWSTVVIPPKLETTSDPNVGYRKDIYRPFNQLPFERRHVFSDSEAINATMRRNRAVFKQQMAAFMSWQYEVEFPTHSQNGKFFASDTIMSVNDTVHDMNSGLYVQSVRRSMTVKDGARAKLIMRNQMLDPLLNAQVGGGVARTPTQNPPKP